MTSPVRAAIYARYSSDRQSHCSLEDQIRKCREYADRQSWEILPDQIFTDAAISGAVSERNGLTKLLRAAETKPRPFDLILVDDTSRLSRKTSDAMAFSERLKFAGVHLVFPSQGIDSQNEQSDLLVQVHGMVDSLFIKELATKTRRGCEGRVLKLQHAGGRVFGYKSIPIEDPQHRDTYGRPLIAGARLAVDSAEAEIVRKLFRMYASGLSIKACAKQLNAEKIRSPQPREGGQQSWAPSSVRNILRNERYVGVVTWGRTKKVRNPQNGRRINRRRPENEWTRVQVPEQVIVSPQLWHEVEERRNYMNTVFGDRGRQGGLARGRTASSPYIFSGLLRCGVCGAHFVIVSGVGKGHKSPDYGCSAHASRGTCANDRRVSRDVLESELLSKLQRDVLSDAAISYTLQRLEGEIEKQLAGLGGDMDHMRHRKLQLETELRNLTNEVARGGDSLSLRAAITEREKEVAALTAKVLGAKKDSVRNQVRNLRKFVKESLGDVRELIAGKYSNPAATRMHLSRHIKDIVVSPEGEMIRYKGKWNLLGGTDGAGGPDCTTRRIKFCISLAACAPNLCDRP